MSTRAIAPIVGASVAQVKRDARGSNEPRALTDTPGAITKLTGTNSAADTGYWSPEESCILPGIERR
jgi:hypothetical protein